MVDFTVAIVNPDDNSETVSPMKSWLRDHADRYPFDPSEKNSRMIARWLIQNGWSRKETPTEFRLYPPGSPPPVDDSDDDPPPAADDGEYGSFRLEAELRDFLANNLGLAKIGNGTLRLVGVEYPTAGGRIDILAIDDADAYYVFELKRAATPDKAIGQVTRYMGWVMTNLAKGKPVYGVIVAGEISENLKFAILAIPNVSLFEYQISFTLKSIAHAVS
jgi:endonuclease